MKKPLWSLWTSEEKNCKERCRPPKNLNGGLVCLGMPNMAHPKGSQFFSGRVKEIFPNTYTLCTYCAFQTRKLLSKVKLRHTGRKVKIDTPNSETDSVVGTWSLVTRLELTSWRKLGCRWWVRREGEKNQKGHLWKLAQITLRPVLWFCLLD